MSKEKKSPGPEISYGCAYVTNEHTFSLIVGRVLTIIETIGLPTKQENAIKGLMKQAIYNRESNCYINEILHTAIKKAEEEKEKKAQSENSIPSAVNLSDLLLSIEK